jgi:hypothetical protein
VTGRADLQTQGVHAWLNTLSFTFISTTATAVVHISSTVAVLPFACTYSARFRPITVITRPMLTETVGVTLGRLPVSAPSRMLFSLFYRLWLEQPLRAWSQPPAAYESHRQPRMKATPRCISHHDMCAASIRVRCLRIHTYACESCDTVNRRRLN